MAKLRLDFELIIYPDKPAELYYEDWAHGVDTVIQIRNDGMWLQQANYDSDAEDAEPDITYMQIADPLKFFTALVERYETAYKKDDLFSDDDDENL